MLAAKLDKIAIILFYIITCTLFINRERSFLFHCGTIFVRYSLLIQII